MTEAAAPANQSAKVTFLESPRSRLESFRSREVYHRVGHVFDLAREGRAERIVS